MERIPVPVSIEYLTLSPHEPLYISLPPCFFTFPNLFHGSTAIYAATDAAGKYKVALETLAISNASVLVVGTFSALQYTSVRPEQPEKA